MSIFQEDVLTIVQETINSGLDGEELVTEIKNRLDLYNGTIKRRIDKFNKQLNEGDIEDDDLNGLEVFIENKNDTHEFKRVTERKKPRVNPNVPINEWAKQNKVKCSEGMTLLDLYREGK